MSRQNSIPKPGVAIRSPFGTSDTNRLDISSDPSGCAAIPTLVAPRKPNSPGFTTAGPNSKPSSDQRLRRRRPRSPSPPSSAARGSGTAIGLERSIRLSLTRRTEVAA